jgi:hypothetical protein
MLARFMAIPHYTYLVLKMPAPNGVLSVLGDIIISFKCSSEVLDLAVTSACVDTSVVFVAEAKKIDPSDLAVPEQKHTDTALDAVPSTKSPPRRRSASTLLAQRR